MDKTIIDDAGNGRVIMSGGNGWGWGNGGYAVPVAYGYNGGYCDRDRNCGLGLGLGLGLLALGAGALGIAGLMKRNDEGAKYAAAVNQGEMKAGIACNAQGICRLENSLSQLHQNQYNVATLSAASLGIINSQNVNQQKTDAGLAVLANQGGQILQTLNRAAIPSGFYTQPATAAAAGA